MKNYKKKYEDYYSEEYIGKWCDINRVSFDGMGVDEYCAKMKEVLRKVEDDFFDAIIKYRWLSNKFRYDGRRRSLNKPSGILLDSAFGLFHRLYTGYSGQIVSASLIFRGIESYLNDFFPDMLEDNPFKRKFKYPYQHMHFEHLMLVHKMGERLDLLAYGESHEMGYTEFTNHVLNYVNCFNEEAGKDVYIFVTRYSGIGRLPLVVKNKYL